MVRTHEVARVLAFLLSSLTIAFDPMDAAGPLDATFGNGRKVVTNVSGRYDEARAVALEPDGQIVVAGVAGTGSDRDFALARYNADGALDRTFGDGGATVTDVSGGSDVPWAVAVQPDGKIVVAGDGSGDFALVRYNADGTLDSRFGIGGKVTTDFSGDDKVNAVAVQQDGRIVAAGVGDGVDFAVARYASDGTLDATFGAAGRVVTDFSGSRDWAFSLGIQREGEIVVAGATGAFPNAKVALARYTTDGALDTTFGIGGKVAIELGRDSGAHALAIRSDGKIIAGAFVENGSSRDGILIRVNGDGTLDGSFGVRGVVLTDFGGRNFASALAILADGRFVVGGSDDTPPYYDFALARYDGDGTPDVTFSSDGAVLTEFGNNSWINAVAVQADGKVVAVGYARLASGADFAVVLYESGR